MSEKINEVSEKDDLVIKRIFDAPCELVWRAWTEAEHVVKWWAPKDHTTPACKIDLRVGGKYLICMRSKEGQDFWITGAYKEIIPNQKLVCSDCFSDEHGNVVPASHYGMQSDFPLEVEITLLLKDINGKTEITLIHKGLPAGSMKDMTGIGWNEMFDKLAESLNINKI